LSLTQTPRTAPSGFPNEFVAAECIVTVLKAQIINVYKPSVHPWLFDKPASQVLASLKVKVRLENELSKA
jgi:hypothetical protein